MSTSFKTTSGDYTLTCNNGIGTFTVNADMNVVGNITYINSNSLNITDSFITVAANNAGVVTDMGLVAQITATTFAGLRFDTISNAWQISSSVAANGAPISAYQTLGLSNANVVSQVAGSDQQIQFNQGNAFGASANLIFDYANNVLALQGIEVLGNIGTTPGVTPSNAVAIYNNTVGQGGTGVYVLSTSVNNELISKSKAIAYAIIF